MWYVIFDIDILFDKPYIIVDNSYIIFISLDIATLVPEEKLHPRGRTKLVLFSDLTSRPPTHPPTHPAAVQMDCNSQTTGRIFFKF